MPTIILAPERVRVLLVDDDERIRARAAAALTPGCEVVGSVKDGSTALGVVGALRPDVVVLDISMPGMSGFDVAAHLRKAGWTARIVFLSVHEEEEFVLASERTGGIGYVVKRRLVSDLLFAVHEAQAGRSFVSPML